MIWSVENSYSQLPHEFYQETSSTPVFRPRLVVFNKPLASEFQMGDIDDRMLSILAGNERHPGSKPIAQAYAGHQFGRFTMLGDGRALLIGEIRNRRGERFDLQLKGSGQTQYSRGGDGRAALGPMLREYIISEAMFALGIPTTRSLAVVASGEPVYRERELQGAVLARTASSHIRVGTFEYAAKFLGRDALGSLFDYTLNRHFPGLQASKNKVLDFIKVVSELQAQLIAKWYGVGFIHGVMNTDNMLICGETIDFGPCAFMNSYNPETVYSFIDRNGRYAFGRQPSIGQWNLACLGEALLPLLGDNQEVEREKIRDVVLGYKDSFEKAVGKILGEKSGLDHHQEESQRLLAEIFDLMQKYKVDYTNTWRSLCDEEFGDLGPWDIPEFSAWRKKWLQQLDDPKKVKEKMRQVNPAVIPRNHLVEGALGKAEAGDLKPLQEFVVALTKPFHRPGNSTYLQPPESETGYATYCGT